MITKWMFMVDIQDSTYGHIVRQVNEWIYRTTYYDENNTSVGDICEYTYEEFSCDARLFRSVYAFNKNEEVWM